MAIRSSLSIFASKCVSVGRIITTFGRVSATLNSSFAISNTRHSYLKNLSNTEPALDRFEYTCMLKLIRSFCTMKPPVNASLLHDVNIPTNKATFGMGCFWSNDSLFGATRGVIRTRVGYSGGTTKNPHYRSIGDHTEVIELDFDPKTVTFEELLDLFWANHEYGLTTKLKKQYQSMVLYHDEEQRALAEASYKVMQARYGQLRTEIVPAGPFYPAEDYHQKYRLQGHKDLCQSLGMNSSRLQSSHLAARLNGYLVGVGGKAMFDEEVAKLGLDEKQAEYVRRELDRNEGGGLAC